MNQKIRKRAQNGTTLLEILITVVILSIALLAMASLQTNSLKLNQSALNRSQANILAYAIIEKIRLNGRSSNQNLAHYTTGFDDEVNAQQTPEAANVKSKALADMSNWKKELGASLPNGQGQIQCVVANSLCTVSIRWSDEYIYGELKDDDEPSDSLSEFSYQARI